MDKFKRGGAIHAPDKVNFAAAVCGTRTKGDRRWLSNKPSEWTCRRCLHLVGPVRLTIPTCGDCPYVSHSGAFTPGGAQPICSHHKASDTFAAHVDKDDPNLDRWHWKHRVVVREDVPPVKCPIRWLEAVRRSTSTKAA